MEAVKKKLITNLDLLQLANGEKGVIWNGRIFFFRYTPDYPACCVSCEVIGTRGKEILCNLCCHLVNIRGAAGHNCGDFYPHRVAAADADKLIDMDRTKLLY